eukprot:6114188-Pleurochrysis_carterae.AAC.1
MKKRSQLASSKTERHVSDAPWVATFRRSVNLLHARDMSGPGRGASRSSMGQVVPSLLLVPPCGTHPPTLLYSQSLPVKYPAPLDITRKNCSQYAFTEFLAVPPQIALLSSEAAEEERAEPEAHSDLGSAKAEGKGMEAEAKGTEVEAHSDLGSVEAEGKGTE